MPVGQHLAEGRLASEGVRYWLSSSILVRDETDTSAEYNVVSEDRSGSLMAERVVEIQEGAKELVSLELGILGLCWPGFKSSNAGVLVLVILN